MSSNFYIYFLIIDNEILYVGKGKNDRAKKHISLLKVNKHINTKLQNKYNKLIQQGGNYRELIVYDNLLEEEAFVYEKNLIEQIGIKNLCNLTLGGEGGDCITNNPRREEIIEKSARSRIGIKQKPETIEKIQKSKKDWYNSEEFTQFKNKLSEARTGDGNPMFGKKESEEHKKERMKNLLSAPRWNKGLTKETDARLGGPKKGSLPHNAKKICIEDTETKEIFYFESIKSFYVFIKKEIGKCNTKKAYALASGKTERYEKWILVK